MGPTVVFAAAALGLLALVLHQRRQLSALAVRLAEASRVDALTGLLNRRAFEEMLNFELDRSRRTGRPVSLIIGELDGMGRLNAERGHGAGDKALKQVADHLNKWKRRIDSAGRIGGEKFGVLLPETDEHGAFLVAERLRRASRQTFGHQSLPLTISFGVASFPEHGDQFGVLMGAATRAVDAAVELGRDRSVVLVGDDIPMESRILAVADAYEAMTSERSFRSALGEEAALSELQAGAGTQFDASVVETFLAILAGKKPLSLSRAS